ncbi:uncharacterized protein LOC114240658 [Bombyx mandarina]|uniref:Uncharacterized protein LOC114240658 n=1 Tax=Bombyx mandarina TaxID=7092 RepID=A0A6J2JCR4_BOMMA|nr:uncharacterized protein LOC114240658 [Bombyx mandarina]
MAVSNNRKFKHQVPSSECLHKVLGYCGHIARKDGNNFERLIMTGKVDGKRPQMLSPIRGSDRIRTALDSTFHNALRTARDINLWRKIMRTKDIQKGGHDPQQ